MECFIHAAKTKEQLVGLFLILETGRLEGLHEIQVKIPWRRGGGTLVGRAEEQIAPARRLALQPGQFMFPDVIARHIGVVFTFHQLPEGYVVVAIQLEFVQGFGALLDQRVVVISFRQIQVILVVALIRGDELAAHGAMDFMQHCRHLGKQIVRWVATQVLDLGLVEAQAIPQFPRRGAQRRVNVAVGKAVH